VEFGTGIDSIRKEFENGIPMDHEVSVYSHRCENLKSSADMCICNADSIVFKEIAHPHV
jgi:hypothetical protein